MAYEAWSVVYGEQPTASKWNILGTNDASFADGTGISSGAITAPKLDADAIGHGWVEIGRTTLGVAGDTISVANLPARKYLKVLVSAVAEGGTIDGLLTFNADGGANYAIEHFYNNAGTISPASVATQTNIGLEQSTIPSGGSEIVDLTIFNPTTSNKQIVGGGANDYGSTPSSAVPHNTQFSAKWVNASQINRIDITNNGTGNYSAGSEIIVLGKD